MYKYYNNKFKKDIIDISAGEYIASAEDVIISTVLGSCVSVCIYDPRRKMAGLNHFMLVESRSLDNLGEMMRSERYGSYAMESLLNEFIRTGSRKSDLQSKVFGGSRILQTAPGKSMDIGHQNIIYALNFLENEDIPILAKDTGGERPRRIYLFPHSFKVLLKREKNSSLDEKSEIRIPAKKSGSIVLFDQD